MIVVLVTVIVSPVTMIVSLVTMIVALVCADATWSYWLAGGLVVAFVVITVMFVLLTVFMWRRRFVLIMKVVFYFLPYEDNGG